VGGESAESTASGNKEKHREEGKEQGHSSRLERSHEADFDRNLRGRL